MATLRTFLSQSYPPKPTFTEKELQDLNGKVTFHLLSQIRVIV